MHARITIVRSYSNCMRHIQALDCVHITQCESLLFDRSRAYYGEWCWCPHALGILWRQIFWTISGKRKWMTRSMKRIWPANQKKQAQLASWPFVEKISSTTSSLSVKKEKMHSHVLIMVDSSACRLLYQLMLSSRPLNGIFLMPAYMLRREEIMIFQLSTQAVEKSAARCRVILSISKMWDGRSTFCSR